MPEFDKAQVDKYLSQVLDALVRDDKVTLKRFGQQDGFVSNRIRALVWYVPCDGCTTNYEAKSSGLSRR